DAVGEVPAELRVRDADPLRGMADAPCHGGARPFCGVAKAPAAAAEAERPRQCSDQLLHLRACLARTPGIVHRLGVVDLLLQVADAGPERAARALVQHR